jgi:hypothetical protein
MHARKLVLLFLSIPVMIWAADPFVGSWKLNLSKSHYKTGTPPKEQTITTNESGPNQDTTVTFVPADGSPISYHFTTPAKGGTGTVVEGVGFDGVTAKRINNNTREVHFAQGGKEVRTARITISKDGKTMQTALKGTDPQGKAVDANLVYDKQ